MEMSNNHYFYVLECNDVSYYGEYTVDLERRLQEHHSGRGGNNTRMKRPVKIIYAKKFRDKREAMRAEYAFKQLTRLKKEQFLAEAGGHDANTEELRRQKN